MLALLVGKRKAASPDPSDRPLKVAVVETAPEKNPEDTADTIHRRAVARPKAIPPPDDRNRRARQTQGLPFLAQKQPHRAATKSSRPYQKNLKIQKSVKVTTISQHDQNQTSTAPLGETSAHKVEAVGMTNGVEGRRDLGGVEHERSRKDEDEDEDEQMGEGEAEHQKRPEGDGSDENMGEGNSPIVNKVLPQMPTARKERRRREVMDCVLIISRPKRVPQQTIPPSVQDIQDHRHGYPASPNDEEGGGVHDGQIKTEGGGTNGGEDNEKDGQEDDEVAQTKAEEDGEEDEENGEGGEEDGEENGEEDEDGEGDGEEAEVQAEDEDIQGESEDDGSEDGDDDDDDENGGEGGNNKVYNRAVTECIKQEEEDLAEFLAAEWLVDQIDQERGNQGLGDMSPKESGSELDRDHDMDDASHNAAGPEIGLDYDMEDAPHEPSSSKLDHDSDFNMTEDPPSRTRLSAGPTHQPNTNSPTESSKVFATKADINMIQEGLNEVQTDNKFIVAALDQLLDGKGKTRVRYRDKGSRTHSKSKQTSGSAPAKTDSRKRKEAPTVMTHNKGKGKEREKKSEARSDDEESDDEKSEDDSDVGTNVRPKHRPSTVLQRQADVRSFYPLVLQGFANPGNEAQHAMQYALEDVKIPDPPSVEELRDFETNEIGGPSLDNFRLDFRQGMTRGPWNHRAASVFARSYIQSKRYVTQKPKDIEKSFLSHLRTIRKHYEKQVNPRASKTQKQRDVMQRNRRRNRQRNLLNNRLHGVTLHRDLAPYENAVGRMAIDGMSGDESDSQDGNPVYIVYQYFWRHPDVSPFFHDIDSICEGSKRNAFGERSRGNSARNRIPTTNTVYRIGKPVRGLPKNWYNPAWLKTLDEFEIEQLNMRAELSITHTEAVKGLVKKLKQTVTEA